MKPVDHTSDRIRRAEQAVNAANMHIAKGERMEASFMLGFARGITGCLDDEILTKKTPSRDRKLNAITTRIFRLADELSRGGERPTPLRAR